jgi:putative nucleotidyltransferase with HDIG domain
MYLEENLANMNKKYKSMGIRFEYNGEIVRVIEGKEFLLQDKPSLKRELSQNFRMIFSPALKWYIGDEGIARLQVRRVKFEPTRPLADMQKLLYEEIAAIQEEPLKNSLMEYLKKTPYFLEAPAAKGMHHNYRHGLLEHTLQTIKMARLIAKAMADEVTVDFDVLIAGALLHDVGKVNSYSLEGDVINTTEIYAKQNHIINGVKIVAQEIKSAKLDELIHIVASHHNIPDWGSPVEPKTPEAWIIHTVENLSSKIMG